MLLQNEGVAILIERFELRCHADPFQGLILFWTDTGAFRTQSQMFWFVMEHARTLRRFSKTIFAAELAVTSAI